MSEQNLSDAPSSTSQDRTAQPPKLHPATMEIIRRLTKAQKAMLIIGGVTGDAKLGPAQALQRMGLFYMDIDSPNGRYGFFRPSSLGERVRGYLKAKAAIAKAEARS